MHSKTLLVSTMAGLAMAAPQGHSLVSRPGSPPESESTTGPTSTRSADLTVTLPTTTSAHTGVYTTQLTFSAVPATTATYTHHGIPTPPPMTRTVTLDPNGIAHLADDGVWRSYAANGSVLAAVPLTNEQIFGFFSRLPSWYKPLDGHLEDVFAGVDGHDVAEAELMTPGEKALPVQMRTNFAGYKDEAVEEAYAEWAAQHSINPDLVLKRQTAWDPFGLPPVSACSGVQCSSSLNCQILGCSYCGQIDAIIMDYNVCIQ